jgi:hypothetical protein
VAVLTVTTSATFFQSFDEPRAIPTAQMLCFWLGVALVVAGVLMLLKRPSAPGGDAVHAHVGGGEKTPSPTSAQSPSLPLCFQAGAAGSATYAVPTESSITSRGGRGA